MAKRNPENTSFLQAPRVDVGPRWQAAFDTFMESGRLDHAFRAALDDDVALKQAVDEAFRQQVAALGRIGSAFRAQRDAVRGAEPAVAASAVASVAVAGSGATRPFVAEGAARALSESLLGLTSAPSETRPAILQDARDLLVGAQCDPVRGPAAEEALRGLSALADGVTASG